MKLIPNAVYAIIFSLMELSREKQIWTLSRFFRGFWARWKMVESQEKSSTYDSHKRIYDTTTESLLKLHSFSFSLPQKTYLLRDPQRLYKVVFVGDSYVGKTSLMHRVCNNAFVESFNATIGKDNSIMLLCFPYFCWLFQTKYTVDRSQIFYWYHVLHLFPI